MSIQITQIDITAPFTQARDAYQLALANGFEGTLNQWLESQNEAAIFAEASSDSADAASLSAANASGHKDAAAASAVTAGNQATAAGQSASAASGSADAAAQSVIDAADASRLTLGTVTTSTPGAGGSVSITGVAGAQALNFVVPQGPQGLQGDTGPQGPQGDAGPQGDVGPQGDAGPNAVTSATSSDGTASLNVASLVLSEPITSGIQTKLTLSADPQAEGDGQAIVWQWDGLGGTITTATIASEAISSTSDKLIFKTSEDGALGTALDLKNSLATFTGSIAANGLVMTGDSTSNTFLQSSLPPAITSNAQQNTGVGNQAMASLTTGAFNSGLGYRALNACTTGRDNSGVGHSALSSITFGSYNAAVGSAALQNNLSGNSNAALGMEALQNLTTVGQNSALGNGALRYVTVGAGNTGIGFRAGFANVLGEQANLTQGKHNTLLGNSAGVNLVSRNQSIALGYRATTKADGELAIGAATAAIKGGTTGVTYNATNHGIAYTVTAPANPSTPVGWLDARINGTLFKIPLYQ
jgi:hypothetical protein